jgi:hypothetical protein
MNEENELGWLALTDKSRLVLTSLYVFQHHDRGMFGDSHEILPLTAITTLRLSWRRSGALVLLGSILVVVFLVLMTSSFVAAPGQQPFAEKLLNLSATAVFVVQYAALLAAVGIFVAFWFYKRHEVQIMASTGSVGGAPRSYEEARKFCSLVITALTDRPAAAASIDKDEPATPPKDVDRDWKL